jgi:excinuclease UvrABC nuclease subunit
MLDMDCGADFDPARDADFFAALPPHAAVFRIEPRAEFPGAEPYLLRTADLRKRLERLLGPADPASKRLNLRGFARAVRYRLTSTPFEQAFVFLQHARAAWPARYRERMRLRPPAVLKVNLANAYPRCYATRRIGNSGAYFGPFPSRRAADHFAGHFLDLFKIRRCQIKIRRDPSFPGCMYSEMKMCLAPCFAGCTDAEYGAEVDRVVSFLSSRGASHESELQTDREAASEQLDFERAAALQHRLEKVADVLRGLPEHARRIENLNAVVLQLAAEPKAISVFAVRAGRISEPFFLRFSELARPGEPADGPRSAEEILRDRLESEFASAPEPDPRELEDHLALLARWFYSKPRAGEILFRSDARPASRKQAKEEWPYRRILRACSRLLSPAANSPETQAPPTP